MFAYIQRLGKSLLLPVAVLPVCGLLLGIGYMLAPAAMAAGGGYTDTSSIWYFIGLFMIKGGLAIIDAPSLCVLFAVGVAVGMAKKHDGTAAVAGVVCWLIITKMTGKEVIVLFMPNLDEISTLAFAKLAANPLIGIVSGLIAAGCYNKFKDVKLPEFLAFFSGKRCVAIITAFFALITSAVLYFVWPWIFGALVMFGNWIVSAEAIGVGIYMCANRLLIPTGLHHALNNVIWFDTIGIGDLTLFWQGKTSADVTWSLGAYMSGFFPCMMFGIPGAALAMILCSKNRKRTFGALGSVALCAFLCGVTEPFEFMFMFLAFPLYILYSLLYGIFGVITYFVGFRAGFSFSAGCVDLILSSSLPAAQNIWMIIPLGIGAFVLFFLVFYAYAKIKKMPIPGSGDDESSDDDDESKSSKDGKSDDKFKVMAKGILEAVGGKDNIEETDYCVTRLRLVVKDSTKVDDEALKKAGAAGVVKPTKKSCQVIIGPQVEFVYNEFIKLTGE